MTARRWAHGRDWVLAFLGNSIDPASLPTELVALDTADLADLVPAAPVQPSPTCSPIPLGFVASSGSGEVTSRRDGVPVQMTVPRNQGRGVGTQLLIAALLRIAALSSEIGFEVVVVHALSHDASVFYRRAGFIAAQDQPLHLYLPVRDLRRTFGIG